MKTKYFRKELDCIRFVVRYQYYSLLVMHSSPEIYEERKIYDISIKLGQTILVLILPNFFFGPIQTLFCY